MAGSLNRESVLSDSLPRRSEHTKYRTKDSKYCKPSQNDLNKYEKYLGADADLQWGDRFRTNQDTSVSGREKDTFYHRKNMFLNQRKNSF